MERIIETIDGEILVKTACDYESGCSLLDFYKRDGYDEEAFPWTFACEANGYLTKSLEDYTDEELAEMYYDAV